MDTLEKVLKKLQEGKRERETSEVKKANELARSPIEISKYRHERTLMAYPFCSTSKRKRTKPIEYESSDGKRKLLVVPSHVFGMAKIWDFDIVRYALSKAGEIKLHCGHFPSSVEFTVYECLKAIGRRPLAGKNYLWFKEALKRLTSTTYFGTVFSKNSYIRDEKEIEEGFNIISYKYTSYPDESKDKIKIIFNEKIIESVNHSNGLLAIKTNVLKEESGIKKRLLELVDVYKGNQKEWKISLKQLQAMCAHDGDIKYFKRELKLYQLPFKIHFYKNFKECIVRFSD